MYKKMYYHLFNACTDALQALEDRNIWDARRILIEAQQATEEMYISAENFEDGERTVAIFRETSEADLES